MANRELIDSYEEFVSYTKEIRESLDILHDWLSREPKFDKPETYFDLISAHGQHFAPLNLIMFRMDNLVVEHRKIIENEYRER